MFTTILSDQDKKELIDRFIRYCKIDSHSDPHNDTEIPSTKEQWEMANLLVKELTELGLKPRLTEHCYIYATIPETAPTSKTIGLVCHMDTSSEAPSKNIKPMIHTKITGEDLQLPAGITISGEKLKPYAGHDIVTSDGSTLLGADDKSGLAAVMQYLSIITKNPSSYPHGKIIICFTPDEEIGNGVTFVNKEEFPVDYAYTIDGSAPAEIEYETFNAYDLKIKVKGRVCHPGDGYNTLINSISIANDIINSFPKNEVPEKTKGREGFYYLNEMNGNTDETTINYIIRDFEKEGMEKRIKFCKDLLEEKKKQYPKATIESEFIYQYPNMKEYLLSSPDVISLADEAVKECLLTPSHPPVRGGTDGAELSEKGIPCPNIFTGGINFHSKYEFVSINVMYKVVEVLIRLLPKYIKKE